MAKSKIERVMHEFKDCTKCGQRKSLYDFAPAKTKIGVRASCKECCNKQNKNYYEREKERICSRMRAFNHTEHRRSYARKYQKERARRICEELASRPRANACEICHELQELTVYDHNHKTGEFRGWLCNRCNRVLGLCADNPSLLAGLASYLIKI